MTKYTCYDCGRTFNEQRSLIDHRRDSHTEDDYLELSIVLDVDIKDLTQDVQHAA